MRLLLLFLLTLLPALCRADFVAGHVLLAKKQGVPDAALERIAGGPVQYLGAGTYLLKVPAGAERAAAARLNADPNLRYAALDEKHLPSATADDPYFTSEWHLATVGAPTAWDLSLGAGVTVAVLDSGADYNHPDLAANLLPGWNFYDNNADVQDQRGHGTSVAGVIGALTNNALGVASMAPQVKILPLRIADLNGYGYDSLMVQAINYAVAHGAKIANISYQGVAGNPNIRSAGQFLKDNGGLLVVAAGNNDGYLSFSSTTTLIAVAATDQYDAVTSFSDWGDYVSMAAPGVQVACPTLGGGYGWCVGTSFSSPIVAGTLALMMAANPGLPNTQIESLLYSTAVDLGDPGRDQHYGYGRVDAAAAVAAAAQAVVSTPAPPPPAPADTQAPTVAINSPANGATLGGGGKPTVQVKVSASDDVAVTQTTLSLDGKVVATAAGGAVSYTWNVKKAASGVHVISASASDAAGNTTSTSINVTIR